MYRFSTLLTLIALLPFSIFAQSSLCDGSRFFYEMAEADSLQITTGIVYGSNVRSNGDVQELALDIYEPPNDPATNRPLIILAHGGSFVFGDRTQEEITQFCVSMAQRGYVTVSITYRLQPFLSLNSADSAIASVARAMQDMKAAVRFFKKDVAENNNTYGIDTNYIFVGGSSAGAVAALHLGFVDDKAEFNEYTELTDTSLFDALGGIEGTSGNPGYSSKVQGVINLCGALGMKGWIDNPDVRVISMHGTSDETVPYDDGFYTIPLPPFSNVPLAGSGVLDLVADTTGVDHELWTWPGQGHVPYVASQVYADSVTRYLSVHLYDWVCNEPAPEPFIVTSVSESLANSIEIYPNPASDVLHLKRPSGVQAVDLRFYNSVGQLVLNRTGVQAHQLWLPREHMPAGLYIVELITEESSARQRLILK